MAIRNKMWMTGNLEWVAVVDGEETFLGKREVPIPLEEGDEWVNLQGDRFRVENEEIKFLGREAPPEREW